MQDMQLMSKLRTVTSEWFKVQCLAQRHLASKLQRVEQAAYEDRKETKTQKSYAFRKHVMFTS